MAQTNDYSEYCDQCQEAIQRIINAYNAGASKAQILSLCKETCNLAPQELVSTCKSIADSMIDSIMAHLKKGVSPYAVCKKATACNSVSSLSSANGACDECKTAIQEVVDAYNAGATQDEIEALIDKKCDLAPKAMRSLCKKTVKKNMDKIMEMLKEGKIDAQALCKQFKVCGTQNAANGACDECKTAIQEVVDAYNAGATQDEIEALIDKKCDLAPKAMRSLCKKTVKKNMAKIMEMLKEGKIDSQALCKKFKVCSSPNDVNNACDECKTAVQEVVDAYNAGATQEEIEALIDTKCDLAPKAMQSLCKKTVKKNMDKIMEMLKEGKVDAQALCKQYKVCSSPNEVNGACDECKTAIQEVVDAYNAGATQEEIEALIDKKCDLAPKAMQSLCKKTVKKNMDKIMEMLKEGKIDSQALCKQFKVCGTQNELNAACDECKTAVQEVVDAYNAGATQDEIEALIDKKCDLAPKAMQSLCKKTVKKNMDKIMEMLKEGKIDAQALCKQYKVCGTQNEVNGACDECKTAIQEVVDAYNAGATQDEIEALIDKKCDLAPKAMQSLCKKTVKKNMDKIMEMLKEGKVDSQALCKQFKVCGTQNELNAACDECKTAVQEVVDAYNAGATQTEIEALIDKKCDLAPKAMQSLCKKTVKKNMDKIMEMLKEGKVDAQALCKQYKVCGTQNETPAVVPRYYKKF